MVMAYSIQDRQLSGKTASRFVIVGGPGQGKSTFGQYLCQLYRAAILKDRPKCCLDDRVISILRQFEKKQDESVCFKCQGHDS
jgi:hypothetical protein